MPIHHMIETNFIAAEKEFLFKGYVEVAENEPTFSAFFRVFSEEETELKLQVKFLAKNPLIIEGIVIEIATVFGFCLAQKLVRGALKEAIKCYRKAKKENPDDSILDRVRKTGLCLTEKGDTMLNTFTDAAVDCLPFSLGGNEDGE